MAAGSLRRTFSRNPFKMPFLPNSRCKEELVQDNGGSVFFPAAILPVCLHFFLAEKFMNTKIAGYGGALNIFFRFMRPSNFARSCLSFFFFS